MRSTIRKERRILDGAGNVCAQCLRQAHSIRTALMEDSISRVPSPERSTGTDGRPDDG